MPFFGQQKSPKIKKENIFYFVGKHLHTKFQKILSNGLYFVNFLHFLSFFVKNHFFFWLFFWLFWPKTSQNGPKIKKIGKIQTVWWNFLKFGMLMLPNKENAINLFLDFGLFWPFFNQKTAKKKKKDWQNPNRSIKFSEI